MVECGFVLGGGGGGHWLLRPRSKLEEYPFERVMRLTIEIIFL